MKIVTQFLIGLFLLSCSSSKTANNSMDIDQMAKDKLGESYEISYNSAKTYALCTEKPEKNPKNPRQYKKFIVVDMANQEVIHESGTEGSASWHDDMNLSIFTTPGIMREGETSDDYTKIFNLKTKKSMPKKDFLKLDKN